MQKYLVLYQFSRFGTKNIFFIILWIILNIFCLLTSTQDKMLKDLLDHLIALCALVMLNRMNVGCCIELKRIPAGRPLHCLELDCQGSNGLIAKPNLVLQYHLSTKKIRNLAINIHQVLHSTLKLTQIIKSNPTF